jgi:hypothetical protein
MKIIKKEYNEILLFGFITCNTLNCKDLRTKIFNKGTMV